MTPLVWPGLALFTVVGFSKAYALGYPFWIAIIMGSITGAAGGVLRDIFINEIPLIFRKEIYAMACVIGGLVYWICLMLDMESVLAQIIGGVTIRACTDYWWSNRVCSPYFSSEI